MSTHRRKGHSLIIVAIHMRSRNSLVSLRQGMQIFSHLCEVQEYVLTAANGEKARRFVLKHRGRGDIKKGSRWATEASLDSKALMRIGWHGDIQASFACLLACLLVCIPSQPLFGSQ